MKTAFILAGWKETATDGNVKADEDEVSSPETSRESYMETFVFMKSLRSQTLVSLLYMKNTATRQTHSVSWETGPVLTFITTVSASFHSNIRLRSQWHVTISGLRRNLNYKLRKDLKASVMSSSFCSSDPSETSRADSLILNTCRLSEATSFILFTTFHRDDEIISLVKMILSSQETHVCYLQIITNNLRLRNEISSLSGETWVNKMCECLAC